MTTRDIGLFINKLSITKTNGRNGITELDYLWRQFKGVEFELSKRELKQKYFTLMLAALSEEKLIASFNSPDFLTLLSNDSYVEVVGNTLNRSQLKLFAADSLRHDLLNLMIKKLKPDFFLLGKLVAITSHATEKVRDTLMMQLSHLAHPTSFKLKLIKLAEHFIHANSKTLKKPGEVKPNHNKALFSKWTSVRGVPKPVYSSGSPVKKVDLSEDAFAVLLSRLQANSFLIDELKIMDDLDNLSDPQIRILVDRAADPEYSNLLSHLWIIESKPIIHKHCIDSRENRLRVVLQHVSTSQLKCSIAEGKFWDIFRNTHEPYCKMAAQVLSPHQFATIIANISLDRHGDFAVLISKLQRDNVGDRERIKEIIEAVIPYTSPWIVLVLEFQIKSLLGKDKSLVARLMPNLELFLSQSLERPEVLALYDRDVSLNKKAIERFIVVPAEVSVLTL